SRLLTRRLEEALQVFVGTRQTVLDPALDHPAGEGEKAANVGFPLGGDRGAAAVRLEPPAQADRNAAKRCRDPEEAVWFEIRDASFDRGRAAALLSHDDKAASRSHGAGFGQPDRADRGIPAVEVLRIGDE